MPLHFPIRTYATWLVLLVAATPTLVPAPFAAQGAGVLPALPSVFLNTASIPPTGAIIQVPAGGDLQAALDAAQRGDTIMVAAGATFTGPFTLPNKPGAGWIVVRTSAPDSALPLPTDRIDPSYAPVMPKLLAGNNSSSAIRTVSGAHHFRFIGIEVHPIPGTFVISLIDLGSDETTVTALPNNIIFDRCYVHGDPTVGARRGIEMNAASSAVIDSYVSDIKDTRTDATAIWVVNGSGPFKITNNYLEASAESVMFGGQDPTIPNLVPADIEIRGNHFAKPLSWRVGDPTYAGTHWLIKNLLELKNARRVLVDGNILEYAWPDIPLGQDGFAALFTPRNQSGGAPWSTVEDVTFRRNIVRHTTEGIAIHGTDNNFPSHQTQRILIQNNLFVDIGAFSDMPVSFKPPGVWIWMDNGGAADITVDHNTAFQTNDPIINNSFPSSPTNFVFTNNITPSGPDVINTTSLGLGLVFDGNVIISGNPSNYPLNNFFPSSLAQVGFVNYAGGDYRLALSSPYRNAGTDGKDIGANIFAINNATANVISGISPTASPSPPTLSVTPRVIDFGTVVDGASADQSFTIMNPGESTVSGTVSTTAPFSVVSGGSFSLAAGASQSIVVRFSPSGAGGFVTSVNFAWNGGATRRAVIGIGTGIADRDPKTSSARLGRRGSLARGMRSAPSTP